MRYRIPGEMPALGLAAIGWMKVVARLQNPKPCGAGDDRNQKGTAPDIGIVNRTYEGAGTASDQRSPASLLQGWRSRPMRIGRRVVKASIWGLVLCLSILAGGLWCAYWYMTDSRTAAKLIREHAVRYFPTAGLEPGRVRVRLFGGEVALRDLKLSQSIDGSISRLCGFLG